MRPALALGVYVIALNTLGSHYLARARWTRRAPRLGVAAWQVLNFNIVSSLILGSLAMTLGLQSLSVDFAQLIHVCAATLRETYAAPAGSVASLVGLTTLAALASRIAWCMGRVLISDSRRRRAAISSSDLIGRRGVVAGVTVLDHATPCAFCIPGRPNRIVVTSAAVFALDAAGLEAVIAHEQAHVRGSHHLPLALSRGLLSALPWMPAFSRGHEETAALIEMVADDSARRRVGGQALTQALQTLAVSPAPRVGLAAAAVVVQERLQRLQEPPRPLPSAMRLLLFLTGGLALVLPAAIVAAPAYAALADALCLIP